MTKVSSPPAEFQRICPELVKQYGNGLRRFTQPDGLYDWHLAFRQRQGPRGHWRAARRFAGRPPARFSDVLAQRWVATEKAYDLENPKRVYYLSMEFLIGRSLANNVDQSPPGFADDASCGAEPSGLAGSHGGAMPCRCTGNAADVAVSPRAFSIRWPQCNCHAVGYGLRYEYGMFRQNLEDGFGRREQPRTTGCVIPIRGKLPGNVGKGQRAVELLVPGAERYLARAVLGQAIAI